MVILLLSPIACALVTTSILIVTFYSGRWWGMKMTMNCIEDKMKEYEQKELEKSRRDLQWYGSESE